MVYWWLREQGDENIRFSASLCGQWREGDLIMGLFLTIPDSVVQAIRLPEKRLREEMLLELAVALYAQEALSFGKGRELAGLSKYEFGRILGQREIARHYSEEELEDDLAYAHG
jgi:predicted HTH domain antitoxin